MKLVVGLGNPGSNYAQTRHNVGFMVVEYWQGYLNASEFKNSKKFECQLSHTPDGAVLLMKPQTFMNSSGRAVAKVANYYRIAPDDILLVHDDLDLAFGDLRLRRSQFSSSGGHRGVESVINYLKSRRMWRLKLGIRNSQLALTNPANFVLNKFSFFEKRKLAKLLPQTAPKLEQFIRQTK